MRISLDCLPCHLRQVLEASRMVTDDAALQEEIMRQAVSVLCAYGEYASSPEIARDMHRIVKEKTGQADPYRAIKDRAIRSALRIYPFLRQYLEEKQDKLYWALKIAATGNIIDSAISGDVTVDEGIRPELDRDFTICDIDAFRQRLSGCRTVLIIADNAGETVFDRLLVEQLSGLSVIYAVREEPIINDATVEDALASGLSEGVEIVSSGCTAPGTILRECTRDFQELFARADIVISKGQGNYETLSGADREIFFLLKAKCPLIASRFSVAINSYVFHRHAAVKEG